MSTFDESQLAPQTLPAFTLPAETIGALTEATKAAADAFREFQTAMVSVLANASPEFLCALRTLRVRQRCPWHCKRWERYKNGRRPIKR